MLFYLLVFGPGAKQNASPLMMSGVRRKYTLHGSTLLAGSHSVTSCRLCLSVTGKPRPGPPGRLQSGTAAAFRRTLPPSGPLSIRRSAVSSLSVPFYTGSVALEGGKVKGCGEGIQEKIWIDGRKRTTKAPWTPEMKIHYQEAEDVSKNHIWKHFEKGPGPGTKTGGKGLG